MSIILNQKFCEIYPGKLDASKDKYTNTVNLYYVHTIYMHEHKASAQ